MSSSDSRQSVSALGEHALIARLQQRIQSRPPFVTIGIGDDAAVLEPDRGALEVLTTDSLVEGVHFRREWTSASAIGHKALAVNLSDIAAMGATPRACLLSLALPADFAVADFDALLDGFVTLGDATGTPLVGGNLTRSPGPLVVDVTAFGSVRRRRLLRRAGGRPGDELYVSGWLGAAAAGLAIAEAGLDRTALSAAEAACVERYERPTPRLRLARIVATTHAAGGAMDLSDGLADAARQMAIASGTGVIVDTAALPIAEGTRTWTGRHGGVPLDLALAGGEDYELLFAVARRQRSRLRAAARRCDNLPLTCVGRLTKEPGFWLDRDGTLEPLPAGFVHF